jgi:hypothetical protein
MGGAIAEGLEKQQYKIDQAEQRKRLNRLRQIAGEDVLAPIEGTKGFQHRAIQNSGYVAREGEPFVRRAIPKVKGKAAKKLHKKQRHQQRNRIGNAGTP